MESLERIKGLILDTQLGTLHWWEEFEFAIYNPKCKVYHRVLRVSSTGSWDSSIGISL